MAFLPPISQIKKEDFPGESWAEKLLWPINRFMTAIYSALNNDLTFKENVRGQVQEFTFTNTATNLPIQFQWTRTGVKPTDLWVTAVTPQEGSATPTAAVWAEWGYDGSVISISQITGLVANKRYLLRFIIVSN